MAKEEIKLAELYFRQAQKRYLKTKEAQARQNSQDNAKAQQDSIGAKGKEDKALELAKSQNTQREIVLKGMFDLAKANVPMPTLLQQLVQEIIVNVEIPVQVENKQMGQAIQQEQMIEEQQIQEQELQEQSDPVIQEEMEAQQQMQQQPQIA